MEFRFNINKKHAFIIIALFVISGFGIAQTILATPNPGHSYSQIEGVPVNCLRGSNYQSCQTLDGAPVGSWTARGEIAAYSAESYRSLDSDKLDNIDSTGFCRNTASGWQGCPNIPTISPTTVYKLPGTSNCGGTAFLCKPYSSGYGEILSSGFSWMPSLSSWGYNPTSPQRCSWVLCTQSS